MKEDVKLFIEAAWENHRGKTAGTLLGLVLGIAILLFGFWNTVFVLLCAMIGLFIGIKVDRNKEIAQGLERWLPPFFHR